MFRKKRENVKIGKRNHTRFENKLLTKYNAVDSMVLVTQVGGLS